MRQEQAPALRTERGAYDTKNRHTRHNFSLFISFKRTVEDAGPYNVNPQNSQAHFGEPLQREPQKFILRFGKPLQKSRAKIALLFVALKGVKHGNYVGNAF